VSDDSTTTTATTEQRLSSLSVGSATLERGRTRTAVVGLVCQGMTSCAKIKEAVKAVVDDGVYFELSRIEFQLVVTQTRDMNALVNTVTELLLDEEMNEEDTEHDEEIYERDTDHDEEEDTDHKMSILQVGGGLKGKKFLGCLEFPKNTKVMYIRHFYEALYKVMLKHWSPDSEFDAVVLTGNAGTGKSWFQAYALRRLAQDRRAQDQLAQDQFGQDRGAQAGPNTYRFVVRQVDQALYLHDLSTLNVYRMKCNDTIDLEVVVSAMTETLYFFEPGENKTRSPTYLAIPSLCTLSPNVDRIHTYRKHTAVLKLYFPVWSSSEYEAVGRNQNIAKDEIDHRFFMYGGILRHLFANRDYLRDELKRRLQEGELEKFLLAEIYDVDTVTGTGKASGYLVCYTDIPIGGEKPFRSRKLVLTSMYVRESIREHIRLVTEEQLAMKVLRVLNNVVNADLGGWSLESTVATMIAGGSDKTPWSATEVETVEWMVHTLPTAEVVRVDSMLTYKKPRALLVSSSRNFPVVDIVDSLPDEGGAVNAYQVTWRDKHPFTMRSLCDMRGMLNMDSERKLKIFFVVPQFEDLYARRHKKYYCKDFKTVVWNKETTETWNNTSIYVLRPDLGWKQAIDNFTFSAEK
jgi:hypothetical protein